MITPITYPTALHYWLGALNREEEYALFKNLSDRTADRSALLRDARIFRMEEPLHVLCASAEQRRKEAECIYHVSPRHLPAQSIIRLTDNLYIVSPECCFLLAADHYSVQELVCLANDLCSIYRRDAMSPFGQESGAPVTTAARISEYLDSVKKVDGLKKAKQAIQYSLNRSNSPMESKLAAEYTLPMFRGGFGLTEPALNQSVCLCKSGAAFLGRDTCCCDAVWEEERVIVEYDSNLSHLTPEQHFRDKNRATALAMSGYTVITITAGHLQNHFCFDKLCLDLRNALQLRTHMDRFEKYREIRWDTINELFYNRGKEGR